MIIAGSRLIDTPILGLQTDGEVARTVRAIVDPANLGVVAFEVGGSLINKNENLLLLADIRELSDVGLIIDSIDEFIAPDDVIKLGEVYRLNFELEGMNVIDEHRRKLGRINGYTVDTNGFLVQQLSVKRPFLKSLNDTELLIHRTQITEINDKEIVVHSEAEIPEPTTDSVRASYVNPFRKATPEAEHADQE